MVRFSLSSTASPDTRMSVNNPASPGHMKGLLCVEGRALTADRSGQDHAGTLTSCPDFLSQDQNDHQGTKFPHNVKAAVVFVYQLLSFCFFNITSRVCGSIQMEHAGKTKVWGRLHIVWSDFFFLWELWLRADKTQRSPSNITRDSVSLTHAAISKLILGVHRGCLVTGH